MLVRDEFEFEVPLSEAEDMLSAALGTVIEKTRYRVPGGAMSGRSMSFPVPMPG